MGKTIRKESLKSRSFLVACIILFLIITISCEKAKKQDPLDEFFEEIVNRTPLAGVTACIIKEGKAVWSKGYGWADIENEIPMSPDKVQNIGSISKTFTRDLGRSCSTGVYPHRTSDDLVHPAPEASYSNLIRRQLLGTGRPSAAAYDRDVVLHLCYTSV